MAGIRLSYRAAYTDNVSVYRARTISCICRGRRHIFCVIQRTTHKNTGEHHFRAGAKKVGKGERTSTHFVAPREQGKKGLEPAHPAP